jgi:5-methyltetrahydrofolate--homocysteine methyltransferase
MAESAHVTITSTGSAGTRQVTLGHDMPFVVVGERINPTGRRLFQEQLRAGDLSAIERDVAAQVAGGAMVLDVNMGVPLTDEPALLGKAVTLVQQLTDLPICIDSSVVEALDAGLCAYQGRALVNSVTAEHERMAAILPMVKHHGAAVICLPNDADEIPMRADKRIELTKKILDTVVDRYGLSLDDIVIDALAMPIGADPTIVAVAYETLARIRDEFGVNTTLGASNVSFGMPDRPAINAAFLPMAISSGLTSAIMDARTPEVVRSAKAADLLLGRDEWGAAWISSFRAGQAAAAARQEAARATAS